jgi:antirestriction protein ArdC
VADVSELLRRLEQGLREVTSQDAWRRYLKAQAQFHDYSPGNVLLILSQRPDATRVAGFRTWLALGRHVRRGEKGIAILAPMTVAEPAPPSEAQETPGEEGSGRDVKARKERRVLRFRVVHVFDVAQTEGDPLPEPPAEELRGSSDAGRRIALRLGRFAEQEGVTVAFLPRDRMPSHAHGCYDPGRRRILVALDLSPDHAAKTLAHELAHHVLAREAARLPRHLEEAAVEGAAFVFCARYGLDTSQYSFGYVAAWAAGEDPAATVRSVSGAVQRVATRLIEAVETEAHRGRAYAEGRAAGLDR